MRNQAKHAATVWLVPPTQGEVDENESRRYLRLAIEEKDWLRKRGLENLTADNTRGMLVIGSDLITDEQKKLKHNNATRGMYSIKTFSDVPRENEAILKNLRGSVKK